jgi:hypothetical protein
MKTTVEIPDGLYRRVKVQAALNGQSVRAFLVDALQQKLGRGDSRKPELAGWRAVFGKAKPEDIRTIQGRLDEEFGQIDANEWR